MKILSEWPLPRNVKTLLPVLVAAACILVGGCASPDFTPYVGQQDWPQGTGCTIKTNCIVPIYYGWPDKPYTVLGVITMSGINNAAVARCAKSKGADALVFRNVLTEDAGTYTTPGYATSYTSGSYIGDQYSGLTTNTYHPGETIPLTVTVSVYDAIKWKVQSQTMADTMRNTSTLPKLQPAQVADFLNALKEAAEKGNAAAQYMLGAAYANGQYVKQDYAEAIKWYRESAEQGNADAQESLGLCYELGQGVPQDYANAVKWYRRGAARGNADAQASLGVCYAAGHGIPKDFVEAYKWLNLASAQGNSVAQEGLSALENVMTPDQIAEAQRQSEAFVPQTETPSSNSSSTASP
jgi:hypothetical protein